MKNNGKTVSFDDVVLFKTGYPFKSSELSANGNFKVIKIKEMKSNKIVLTHDTQSYNGLITKRIENSFVNYNDIVIALTGDPVNKGNTDTWVGRSAIYKESNPALLNQRLVLVEPNEEKIDRMFMYYLLISQDVSYGLANIAKGSANQANISHKDVGRFKVSIPEMAFQKKIANILSSLDDKIELNNKINKNLEELAQTLYKRWFVDFEFPNEYGEPYKSSGGEMVESELGLIPKGWYVDLLGRVVNISYGKNLPTKNLILKGYPVFGGNGIIGYTDKFLYKNPKVLVSCRGAASGSVLNSLKNSFITNNSLILEDNEKISYQYLKELSKNRSYFDFVSGSAQPQVTIASISQCRIIIPQRETLNEFTKVMKESNEIIENLYYENIKLAQLRDELLPKLMNNEIEVPIEE